jgi:hypothetical protein
MQINQSMHIVLASGESGNHTLCKQEKMRKFLQIWKQSCTARLSSRYQDIFGLLVPSCCYRFVTELMTVTGLLQVVPTRLIQAVRNKFVCHQLVTNLLEQLLLQDYSDLFQICQQLGTSSANISCDQ